MPITGSIYETAGDDAPYFRSLEELDSWAQRPHPPLDGVLKFTARMPSEAPNASGKLLVCHDYKGGYTESPFSLGYSFNFWWMADIFIYFSHHRVTIPPPGWITAAHRQGVKMLGTLIFEGGSENDCLRLLVGQLPQSKTGPALQSTEFRSLPLSPHYARLLAQLAQQRGFDGYLLNFECPLAGGMEQTRGVAAWIALLREELRDRVGSHSEVIWYDSVVVTGQLAWQDRLNAFNLPFFLPSTGFFTNYTWPPSYTARTTEYLLSTSKPLRDVFVGIDVFGRGSHGGGGFGIYKALEHIAPLSTAIFGQGWTWENTQDDAGFTWEGWFGDDRRLWTGLRPGEQVPVPPVKPNRPGEPACSHGDFLPVKSFFAHHPSSVPFHTTFCPGVGRGWWVNGVRVFERMEGWTDLDKQTSVGNLVWPYPVPEWEDGECDIALPSVVSEITLDDAWNGGSSLRLHVQAPKGDSAEPAFRSIRIPVHSVILDSSEVHEASVWYKLEREDPNVDLDIALSFKGVDVTTAETTASLPGGWTRLCVRIEAGTASVSEAGLLISIVSEDASKPLDFSLLLGQLDVARAKCHQPSLIWADFSGTGLDGTLTWETAVTFAPLSGLTLTGPEDPNPAWPTFDDAVLPAFLYFNILAQYRASAQAARQPSDASWIGTSGYAGRARTFEVAAANLPFDRPAGGIVTFYVQGVTDRGEVLGWDRSVFVDVAC
ncbi:unnamed protein product [Mycena citricolor]|uniref:Cytosolic endo-beta-N-acetylglucosaminidase TIM barrel domain-containing protein n=1 Tax=Mycena citricolor TaxID=2018698 RepID=A0AAD2HJE9_9AGAR|nr:unnamed protein product [Mycena citricolor]